MKAFIEVASDTAKICFKSPKNITNSSEVHLLVAREGKREAFAKYLAYEEATDEVCFYIDDDLRKAKAGWYIGTLYECGKPIKNMRIRVAMGSYRFSKTENILIETGLEVCRKKLCNDDSVECGCNTCNTCDTCDTCDDHNSEEATKC
jgi:glycosyltransferase involved in cell wall biosynthesis